MKEGIVPDEMFLVHHDREVKNLIAWAIEHPGLLGDGFEPLRRSVPLPDGGEIPLVGSLKDGTLVVVDIFDGEEATFLRIGKTLAFLNRSSDWLLRAFPGTAFRRIDSPRVILLGEDILQSFAGLVTGVLSAEFVLMRVRGVENIEGRRLLLVEEVDSGPPPAVSTLEYAGLTVEESRFFRRLEKDREAMRA